VKVTLPTYTDGVCDEGTAKVKVTAPKALSLDNETAMLIVTLSKKDGTTLSTSRTLTSPDRYNSIGNGTAASPYLIYNALQLQSLAPAVNAGNKMTDSCFRMESDIDLSGVCHKVDGTPENDVSWTTDRRLEEHFTLSTVLSTATDTRSRAFTSIRRHLTTKACSVPRAKLQPSKG
jgi:hypothetical protein